MTVEHITVEHWRVVRRFIQFACWNVQFASKKRVAASIDQMCVTDPVSPAPGKTVVVFYNQQRSASIDDSRAISCIVKI